MKKKNIIYIITILVLVFSLVACKKDDEKPNNSNEENHVNIQNVSGENQNETSGEISSEISGETIESIEAFEEQFSEEVLPYLPYLNNIRKYFTEGKEEQFIDYGVSSLIGRLRKEEDPFSKFAYVLQDLNDDGIKEFILYVDSTEENLKNVIISICALKGEEIYNILNSQENMIFKLCEDNVIKMELLDVEYINFSKIDGELNLETLASVENKVNSGDAESILNKYKEVTLDLKKLK